MRLLNSDRLLYDLPDFERWPTLGRSPRERTSDVDDEIPPPDGAPAAPAAPARGEEGEWRGKSALRRRERLRALFRAEGHLTRAEAARCLGVSLPTATEDLKALRGEGFIRKVEPSRAPRSHYFAVKDERGEKP